MFARRLLPLLCILWLTACGGNSGTPTPLATSVPVPTPTPPTVTLQFWTVLPDKGITDKSLDELVQAFQKEYPTISVKVSSAPTYTDLYRKVVASVAAGTLPDLVTGLDADIAQYARLKALVPLDDYLGDALSGLKRTELGDIPPAFMETTRLPEFDNKLYALPFARGVMALYYNWGAMKAIGITNTPRTWDEFKLHAKTLTKNPVRGFAYRSEPSVFAALLLSRGGSLYNAEQTKATFNAAAGVDALTYLSDGVKEGWVYRAEGTSDLSDFAAGRTIFTIASTASIPVYQSAIGDAVKKGGKDYEWGVALLPQADAKKPAALVVGSNIAMLRSTSAKQQAAWLFIKWLMRDTTAAKWAQSAGVLPVRQSARELLKDFFAKSPQQQQALDDLLAVAHPEPNVRPAPDIRDLIDGALANFESGKVSPKAALDDAAAKATLLLNEKK